MVMMLLVVLRLSTEANIVKLEGKIAPEHKVCQKVFVHLKYNILSEEIEIQLS